MSEPELSEINVVGSSVELLHAMITVSPFAAGGPIHVRGLVFVFQYGLGRGPQRRRRRQRLRRRGRFRSPRADRVQTAGRGRGQRSVGQPERVAGPLHLGQFLPERFVLVQEHVQLRRVIVVRDGRAARRRRHQRVIGTGQTVTVVVLVILFSAAVRPSSGRQRVEYRSLRGRTATQTDWRRGRQPALAGRRRRQTRRRPIVRRRVVVVVVVLLMLTVSVQRPVVRTAADVGGQIQVTVRLLAGRQMPGKFRTNCFNSMFFYLESLTERIRRAGKVT